MTLEIASSSRDDARFPVVRLDDCRGPVVLGVGNVESLEDAASEEDGGAEVGALGIDGVLVVGPLDGLDVGLLGSVGALEVVG